MFVYTNEGREWILGNYRRLTEILFQVLRRVSGVLKRIGEVKVESEEVGDKSTRSDFDKDYMFVKYGDESDEGYEKDLEGGRSGPVMDV